jgi:hypothetical protein
MGRLMTTFPRDGDTPRSLPSLSPLPPFVSQKTGFVFHSLPGIPDDLHQPDAGYYDGFSISLLRLIFCPGIVRLCTALYVH